jgi:hypothetical protein
LSAASPASDSGVPHAPPPSPASVISAIKDR